MPDPVDRGSRSPSAETLSAAPGGDPVGGRLGAAFEQSALATSLARLVEVTEALASSEQRIRLLAEGAEDFIIFRLRLRPSSEMEYVSPGVDYGWPRELRW